MKYHESFWGPGGLVLEGPVQVAGCLVSLLLEGLPETILGWMDTFWTFLGHQFSISSPFLDFDMIFLVLSYPL